MEIDILACVPEQIRKTLSNNMTGEVIMANSSGVYLRFGEHIVFLCDITWGLVPIGIGLDGFKKVEKQLCLEEGQSVTVRENKMIFPNGTVNLQMGSKVPEKECPREPEKCYIKQAALEVSGLQKKHGISMLVVPLVLGGEENAVRQLNPYCAQAYPYLNKLMNALADGVESEIRYCVDKMLGLGTGLTPSADDVMMGMLYVFHKLPQKCPQVACLFKESILELCESHTNQVSSAYLKAIIQGAHFERMEHVWQGLCGLETLNITNLTQVGSNSGAEMLLGMLIALRVCGYDVSS